MHLAKQNLGPVADRGLKSAVGQFHFLPEYVVSYPTTVAQALALLFVEYNHAFGPLVEANREWNDDYRYALGKTPVNYAVQIDMVGLADEFLATAATMAVADVREFLRGKIFEIENSLAMYQFLRKIFRNGHASQFETRFDGTLDQVRQLHGRPIALLAITQPKYTAMRAAEFGKRDGETLTDQEVKDLSGFDRFFSPDEFKDYIATKGGRCEYLLYVRSSDPVEKLKKPKTILEHPLLGDPHLRRIIKENAITFNIDDPEAEYSARINDTKSYMHPLGMGYEIAAVEDLLSPGAKQYLVDRESFDYDGPRLAVPFAGYLQDRGVDLRSIENGATYLRAKPTKGAYGCYGHVRGSLASGRKFRRPLMQELDERGGTYIVQPEMPTPIVTNSHLTDGTEYTFIDRNFLGFDTLGGLPIFLGGFRALMSTASPEVQRGRVHGNKDTVWAEIVG